MESGIWLWSMFALGVVLTVVRLASRLVPADPDESEERAALRQRVSLEVRNAVQMFMMAVLFGPIGAVFVFEIELMNLVPTADLTKIVMAFGGLLLLFGCFFLLFGASKLVAAYALYRELKRGAGGDAS